jgi:uncharacterized protein (TIGR02466 family)
MSADDIIPIFPTPIMMARRAIPEPVVAELIETLHADAAAPNVRTRLLTHTPMRKPRDNAAYRAAMEHVAPRVQAYGGTLMGEILPWAVKEIWVNRMEPGGAQKMHNHANSFISGVIYLSAVHPSAVTVFHRHMGHDTFVLRNENERCAFNEYTMPIYKAENLEPGDMVLFPSYLMHEVPPNEGGVRYSAAFNAIPERLESWGYSLAFR